MVPVSNDPCGGTGTGALHRTPRYRLSPAVTAIANRFSGGGSGQAPQEVPDVSARGIDAKADYVLATMQDRTRGLGADWASLTACHVYTVHDFHPLVRDIAARAGASTLVWHYCRPPIAEIEFEMDVRGVIVERLLP